MSEVEQRRKQLPGVRPRHATGAAGRDDGADAARAAKVRRTAWLLGGLALFFYFGYMAWMFLRGASGG
jgi:hypothetical protein